MNFHQLLYPILILIFFGGKSIAQISPGELSNAHSKLEGVSNCTKCHDLGNKVTNNKCLDCHKELKEQISKAKGYHVSKDVKGKECASCHNDHHGRNFEIIKWDKSKFNHELTGYALKNAHAKKKCVDCHAPKYIENPKLKLNKSTFLGLKSKCITCHEDVHQKTLSENCNNCHNDIKFKPAPKFNHNKAKYKLEGKHQKVDCLKCHKVEDRAGKKFQVFTNLPFTRCTDCHADVHNNQFGQNCTQCHSVESFLALKKQNNFDHNKTKYKLEEKHITVDCKSCHKGKFTAPLKFGKCVDCHQDYHDNQFSKNGVSPDCSTCHDLKGFKNFSYTIEQHNQSTFPLNGAHNATPCFDCHKKTEKWAFREIGKRCVDCHSDLHKGFISTKYYPERECKSCHSENSWREITFDHSKTKFELLGVHKTQTCRKCHFTENADKTFQQKFLNIEVSCKSCHADIHFKQFEKNGETDCKVCHEFENWKAAKFDHNTTNFKLQDKHANVQCIKCHKPTIENNNTFINYKISIKCESCHSS